MIISVGRVGERKATEHWDPPSGIREKWRVAKGITSPVRMDERVLELNFAGQWHDLCCILQWRGAPSITERLPEAGGPNSDLGGKKLENKRFYIIKFGKVASDKGLNFINLINNIIKSIKI